MSQWAMVKLGELISKASVKKAGDSNLPILSMTMHEGLVLQSSRFDKRIASNSTANYRVVNKNQLVVGFPIDEGVLDIQTLADEAIVSPVYKIWSIKDTDEILPEFLRLYLRSDRALAFYSLKLRGTTARRRSLPDDIFLSMPVMLPPLEEQRRIAEILKQSSQQISNVRQKLDHLLMISLNTMDAHFTAEAVAGDRGWRQIGDFVISTQYGTSKKANETQGIPVLRMGNITYEGELDPKDLKYVELDELERKKFNLKNGDILFNRTNSPELVGKTTVYDSQSEMTFAGYLVRARTSEDARPEYISGFLNSSYGKAYLRNQAKSIVGMANINAKEFLKIPIPSANESEQGEFASLYIHCRSQINLVRKKITLLEELHQSLATRAFAGQL